VAAPDGVAVARLAVDLAAGVAIGGVVADEHDRPLGKQAAEEQAGQGAAQA
jgi:hypothetical protein